MAIPVQTATGTKWMEISDLLKDDVNLNELQGDVFFDPMSAKVPSGRDVTDEFDIPDISEIEEVDIKYYKKTKPK